LRNLHTKHIDRWIHIYKFCTKIKVGRPPYPAQRGPPPLGPYPCMPPPILSVTCIHIR
jgi:hypothetical protein